MLPTRLLVLIIATVMGAAACGPSPAATATRVTVRVDQIGWSTGESKVARVMGPVSARKRARFQIVSSTGKVVKSGRVGSSHGRWNARYPDVRTINLTSVRRPGAYRIRMTGSAKGKSRQFRIAARSTMFDGLLAKNLRFFQAQRDGADVIGSVMKRKASHLLDAEARIYATPEYTDDGEVLVGDTLTEVGGPVDVSGGWFDAGDFLKFTGTTAYATAALLIAARSSDVVGLDAEAQHGLAWLDRMWDPASRTLYAQVGIGQGNDDVLTDHDVWRLPEADDAMQTEPGDADYFVNHRPVFRANAPGKPIPPSLAGRVAATFALAAQGADDPDEARVWLDKAADVYAQADTTPKDNSTAVPAKFYPEDSWQDDLELAAAELAVAGRALDDNRADTWQAEAADWARAYVAEDFGGSLEVADVSALGHAELIGLDDPVNTVVATDLRRQLRQGVDRADRDPFGMGASYTEFDSVPHALGLVATAQLYEQATGDRQFAGFATRQRNWVLGGNAWGSSFMIGAGSVSPRCPEHQIANLAGAGPLTGAVVNGPNKASLLKDVNGFDTMKKCSAHPGSRPYSDFDGKGSRYVDHVGAWQTVEPAIDFTANAVLAFALSAR